MGPDGLCLSDMGERGSEEGEEGEEEWVSTWRDVGRGGEKGSGTWRVKGGMGGGREGEGKGERESREGGFGWMGEWVENLGQWSSSRDVVSWEEGEEGGVGI